MSDFQTLVGRALSDEQFIRALVDDPRTALLDVGIEPTPELLDALAGLDLESLQTLAAAFGEDKAA